MESKYIASLKRFSDEVRQCEVPPPKKRYLEALENFGRERLSEHFFMRDFMYSEISAVHGIPNIPDDPELAIKAGRGLCVNLLEPLRDIFGHVVIRSAFRSTIVNGYGHEHDMNCSMNKKNFAKHPQLRLLERLGTRVRAKLLVTDATTWATASATRAGTPERMDEGAGERDTDMGTLLMLGRILPSLPVPTFPRSALPA